MCYVSSFSSFLLLCERGVAGGGEGMGGGGRGGDTFVHLISCVCFGVI